MQFSQRAQQLQGPVHAAWFVVLRGDLVLDPQCTVEQKADPLRAPGVRIEHPVLPCRCPMGPEVAEQLRAPTILTHASLTHVSLTRASLRSEERRVGKECRSVGWRKQDNR